MKRNINFLILGIATALTSIVAAYQFNSPESDEGMVKVTIMYPNGEGKTFDMKYYREKHMPMVAELMGDAMKKYTIDEGVGGRMPGDPAPYMAIGYLWFESVEAYGKAFGPVAGKIVGDIPNYTNVEPVLQVSKVIK